MEQFTEWAETLQDEKLKGMLSGVIKHIQTLEQEVKALRMQSKVAEPVAMAPAPQVEAEFRTQTKEGRAPKEAPRKAVSKKKSDQPKTDAPPPKTKNKGKKQKERKRPEAILVGQFAEGSSYAEILKGLKSNEALTEVGASMAKVRRARNGAIILELQRGKEAGGLAKTIQDTLAGKAKVTTLAPRKRYECQYLDELATKEEVSAALKTKYNIEIESETITIRKGYEEGTQTAYFFVPADTVAVIQKDDRLTVGWSICRMREAKQRIGCFRCWRNGHIAKNCNGPDRSKMCTKCGVEGHKRASCPSSGYICLDCGYGHRTGSSSCREGRRKVTAKNA